MPQMVNWLHLKREHSYGCGEDAEAAGAAEAHDDDEDDDVDEFK